MARGKTFGATAAAALAAVALLVGAVVVLQPWSDEIAAGSVRVEVRPVVESSPAPDCADIDVEPERLESVGAKTFACDRDGDTMYALGPDVAADAYVVETGSQGGSDDNLVSIGFDEQTAASIRTMSTSADHVAVVIDGVVMAHARTPEGITDGRVSIPLLTDRQAADLVEAVTPTGPPSPRPTESLTLSATVPADRGDQAWPSVEVRSVLSAGGSGCGDVAEAMEADDTSAREIPGCDSDGVGYRLAPDLIEGGAVRTATAREDGDEWVVDVQLDDVATAAVHRTTSAMLDDAASGRIALTSGWQVFGTREFDEPVADGRFEIDGGRNAFDATAAANFVQLLTASSPAVTEFDVPAVRVDWSS